MYAYFDPYGRRVARSPLYGLGAAMPANVDITTSPDILTAQLAAAALQDAKGVMDTLSPQVQIALTTTIRGVEAVMPALSALQSATAPLKSVQDSMAAADSALSSVADGIPVIGIFVGFVLDVIKDIFESYQPTIEQRINAAAACRTFLKTHAPSPSGGGLDPCTICPPDYFGHTVHDFGGCSEVRPPFCSRPLIGTTLMRIFGDIDAYQDYDEYQRLRQRQYEIRYNVKLGSKNAPYGKVGSGVTLETSVRFTKIRKALEAMRIQGTLAQQGKASPPSAAVSIALWSWLLDILAQNVWSGAIGPKYAKYMLEHFVMKPQGKPSSVEANPAAECQNPVLLEQIFGDGGLYGSWNRTIKPFYSESHAKLSDMRQQANALATKALAPHAPKFIGKAVIASVVKKHALVVRSLRIPTVAPKIHPAVAVAGGAAAVALILAFL